MTCIPDRLCPFSVGPDKDRGLEQYTVGLEARDLQPRWFWTKVVKVGKTLEAELNMPFS